MDWSNSVSNTLPKIMEFARNDDTLNQLPEKTKKKYLYLYQLMWVKEVWKIFGKRQFEKPKTFKTLVEKFNVETNLENQK